MFTIFTEEERGLILKKIEIFSVSKDSVHTCKKNGSQNVFGEKANCEAIRQRI